MVLLALACPIAPVIFAGWGIWHLQQHILGWATGSTAVKSGSLALQHPPDQAQQTKWLYAQETYVQHIQLCTLGSWFLLCVFVLPPVLASSVASPTAVSTPSAAEFGSAPAMNSLLHLLAVQPSKHPCVQQHICYMHTLLYIKIK